MTTRVYEGNAAALLGKGAPALKMKSLGPASFNLHNQGSANVVLGVVRKDRHGGVLTDKDTAVSAEDTGYDGDTVETEFSAELLDNTPICPGSVVVVDDAAAAPNLIDRDGDGVLYTDDDDQDAAGSVNYLTGALTLSYPVGKEPGSGDILADYTYQDELTVGGGKRTFYVSNTPPDVELTALVAADDSNGSFCKVDGVATWV